MQESWYAKYYPFCPTQTINFIHTWYYSLDAYSVLSQWSIISKLHHRRDHTAVIGFEFPESYVIYICCELPVMFYLLRLGDFDLTYLHKGVKCRSWIIIISVIDEYVYVFPLEQYKVYTKNI